MADHDTDPYGIVTAPAEDVLARSEAYEETSDWPVAGGRWHIVVDDGGQERVLH